MASFFFTVFPSAPLHHVVSPQRKEASRLTKVTTLSAIVTGAGSGINLATTELLLAAGTSVVLADLRLRPEAEELVAKYPHDPSSTPSTASAVFHKTDVADWAQLQSLFTFAVETYGKVDIVVNGAGLFEPPSSSFWLSPGISKLAVDKADCNPGVYQTFAVNTMAPIRLAQIAVDYWSGKSLSRVFFFHLVQLASREHELTIRGSPEQRTKSRATCCGLPVLVHMST